MLVLVAALAPACGGGKKRSATPAAGTSAAASQATPAPSATGLAPATATPGPPGLGAQIGVEANLPANDWIDLAARYGRTAGRASASKPFAGEAKVGERRDFIVSLISGSALAHQSPPQAVTVTATLQAKTAHAYFYEDNALDVSAADALAAADLFESTTWPTVTGAFGAPPIPGVDGDPRIIVLQADLGGGVGGYFSPEDEYLKVVRPLSNEAEMVYMDRTLKAGGVAFNVVLAHEFQHLIHFQNDRTEEAWVNEGLSEDASLLVGGAGSSINSFAANPQTQLNFWDSAGSSPHYGAGAAFFRYLASRFGPDLASRVGPDLASGVGGDPVLGAIARQPRDGTAGVDEFLRSLGQSLDFTQVFADWIAANILNRESGRYGNPGHPLDIKVQNDLAAGDPVDGQAHQFGTDYYSLSGLDGGDYVLKFRGRERVPVLPQPALDAGPIMWSNAEDAIDTKLTRDLDLTTAVAPALTFKTWYDIERWYDWGYASVSTDGGATWQALSGDQTSSDDPVQESFGPGYTGTSGGGSEPAWVDERISLTQFAGKKIKLRFEYVTDGGTHGESWAIRDVAVSGTGFRDANVTDGGWISEGWLRLADSLPQTYVVRLIASRADGEALVLDLPLDPSQSGQLRFSSAGLKDPVLAIAGSAVGTNQRAPYTIQLTRP